MAAPIRAVVMASPTRNARRLLRYVMTPKKGQTTDRFVAMSGINGVIPEVAAAQFQDNRKRHGKNAERSVVAPDGSTVTEGAYVQAYHLIQSFAREGEGALDPTDPAAWEEAHRLGRAFAKDLAGDTRMAVVVTQIDGATGCIHNHVVKDSIDRVTGASFASSNVKHSVLAKTHDQVLAAAGYEQQNELKATADERKERSEERARLRHEQWVAGGRRGPEPFSVVVMKAAIREALEDPRSTSFDAYAEVLRERGVVVDVRGEQDRGLTYAAVLQGEDGEPTEPTRACRRRASKLGRRFMRPAVDAAIERHAEQDRQAAVQPASRPTFEELAAVASGTVHDRAAAMASSMTLEPAAPPAPRLRLPTEPPAAPRRATPSRTAQPESPDPHAAARQARIEAMETAVQQRLAAAEAARAVLVRQMAEEDEREAQQEPTSTPAPALAPLPPELPADTRSAPVVDNEPVAPRRSFAELLAEAQRRQDHGDHAGALAPPPPTAGMEDDETLGDDPRSAPAAEPGLPLATAPGAPYRSPVRDEHVRARDVEFRDRVAALDEHVVACRAAGEGLDGEVLEGMTSRKVARYAALMHADTLEVLEWKQQMTAAARNEYLNGRTFAAERIRGDIQAGRIRSMERVQLVQDLDLETRGLDEPELN